jgi:hypothetical protein
MSQDWLNFFSTLAQVAVTVFSIMFLAMQVRSSAWRKDWLFRVVAYGSLVELFVPLLAAMVTLMGGHPWRVAAALAGGLGLGMVVVHWAVYCKYRPDRLDQSEEAKFHRLQAKGSLISLLVYGLTLISAFDPWGGGLYLMAAVAVWLLFSGSFEAWWLLDPKLTAIDSVADKNTGPASAELVPSEMRVPGDSPPEQEKGPTPEGLEL